MKCANANLLVSKFFYIAENSGAMQSYIIHGN